MEPVIHRYLEKRHSRHTTLPLWAVGVFLFVVTVYGGYFGAGLGMLLLAFLSFSDLRSIHHMNLVKSLSGATAVIMTIVLLASGSLIAWYHGVFMGIGSAVGAYATSRLAPEIPPIVIRSIVVFCGCATAIYFFL